MSGLSHEEVDLVRKTLKEESQQPTQDRLTSSGIIVRRRRHHKPEPQPTESEQTTQAQDTAPQSEQRLEDNVVSGSKKPVPSSSDISSEDLEQEPPKESLGFKEAPRSQPSEKQIPETSESETQPPKKAQETEEKETPSPAKHRRKKRSSKKKKQETSPQVTVISRPQERSTLAEETEHPLKSTSESEASGPKQKTEQESESAPTQKTTPQELKKKKKKDKRTVDVSALYEEKDPRKDKVDWKKKKTTEIKDKTGGKVTTRKKALLSKTSPDQEAEPQHKTQPIKATKRKIKMEEAIRVSELAQEMGVKAQEIIKVLINLGVMATINQSLDIDTAVLVAAEFGYEVEKVGFSEEEFILPEKEDEPSEMLARPPVVTIMGHVDHGKTSLLDSIRESHIIDSESGGITQHIGAYHVNLDGNSIVFLDTPGHEAFTEMRSRGAQVTDIVILIVAADDGVMDQTKEAINHARAADVPIVVAINKIDKDNADKDRVKRELAEHGLIPEEWSGDTIFTDISAKQRIGLDQLLEMVLLQAEVLDLKANPQKRARGHIIEARLDKGRGPVGTVLIQEGTLHTGDPFVCGLFHGKVRAMFNDRGEKITEAGPSIPVEVQGFEGVPNAGDEFVIVENDKVAKRISESRQTKYREQELAKETKLTLESFFAAKAEEEIKSLHLILKTDVQGSLEAISEAIYKLNTDEVKINIIHGGIGAITESDIKLASASKAVIIGFNIRPTAKIKNIAEKEGVEIRFYNVIYHLVNEVKEAMAGMLAPISRDVYLGQAEVRETFQVPKIGTVAGCFVLDGKLKRNGGIRLLRDGVVVYTGKLSSLKRFKDDVKEVTKDYECGVGLENFNDIKINDIIEAYEEVQEKATLD
jgi:translation initiation factor IF-2